MEESTKDLLEQYKKLTESNDTCPRCGYCKHCGRGAGYWGRPYWPQPYWSRPFWDTTPYWQQPWINTTQTGGITSTTFVTGLSAAEKQ